MEIKTLWICAILISPWETEWSVLFCHFIIVLCDISSDVSTIHYLFSAFISPYKSVLLWASVNQNQKQIICYYHANDKSDVWVILRIWPQRRINSHCFKSQFLVNFSAGSNICTILLHVLRLFINSSFTGSSSWYIINRTVLWRSPNKLNP
jgi:hypothetical protein